MNALKSSGLIPWKPHGGRWYHWSEVEACFWPGPGRKSRSIDEVLAEVLFLGGIYLLAHSKRAPQQLSPNSKNVKYIGETGEFKRRMGQFGASAGFFGEQRAGHSAGWRWNWGQHDLWMCFVPVGQNLPGHLAGGLRFWAEAQALDVYYREYSRLPEVNEGLPSAGVGA
jgi:hypothetical protein